MSAGIETAYKLAREQYAGFGVDTDSALAKLSQFQLSLPCWQGDDVTGFERRGGSLDGSMQVTGSSPGRARNGDELRQDLEKALALIPGRHRVNLHAIYGDFGSLPPERDEIESRHFRSWIQWALDRQIRLDFNATCFAHPKARSGFTLSDKDPSVRAFWVEHVRRARRIAAEMGRAQGNACIHNLWIPDGAKDTTVDGAGYRARLRESLDDIYGETFPSNLLADSLESKLFGIGTESFVVGSHEFYMGYALKNNKMLCLDTGHFHPTETVSGKISALLEFFPQILVHVSRGVRWDSDHFVILSDELQHLMNEIVWADGLGKIHMALDFFDPSINRVGAWILSARSSLKALLAALLSPVDRLRSFENNGDPFAKFACLEEMKSMPLGAVWDHFCEQKGVSSGLSWMDTVIEYGNEVVRRRG